MHSFAGIYLKMHIKPVGILILFGHKKDFALLIRFMLK